MKIKAIATALLGVMFFVCAAQAADKAKEKPVDDNLVGLTTPNGKLVYDFINLWFNEHKGEEAFDKYVSHDNYLNHAVYSSSTDKPKTFEEEKKEEARIGANPKLHFDIKQLISQGSLVFAHIHAQNGQPGPGRELIMILRVRDGKIIDHWDIHDALKEDSAVFEGLVR